MDPTNLCSMRPRSPRGPRRSISLALAAACAVALAPGLARAQRGPVPAPEGDWIVLSGPARVEPGATLGTLVAVEGPTAVLGEVRGDVVAVGGDVRVEGRIGGRLVALAGDVHLGPSAFVEGDLLSSRPPTLAPGARVGGRIEALEGTLPIARGALGMLGTWLAMTLSLLALSLGLAWGVPPSVADEIYDVAKSGPLAAFGAGALVAIALPLLGVLGIVSVLGLPLGVALLFVSMPIAACGYVGGAWWLGRRIAEAGGASARWPRLLWLLFGLGLLRLGALVPGVHVALWIVASMLGTGAAVLALVRGRRDRRASSPPGAPTGPLPTGGPLVTGRFR